jgi:hypothetical protein
MSTIATIFAVLRHHSIEERSVNLSFSLTKTRTART